MNFVIFTQKQEFLTDVQNYLMIEQTPLQLSFVTTLTDAMTMNRANTVFVVTADVINEYNNLAELQATKYGFASSADESEIISAAGVHNIGLITTAENLIHELEDLSKNLSANSSMLQTPAYENSQMPQQTPAYGMPQMPQQTPVYENPHMPQQTPAYENPQMPQQTPAYENPQMPQQTPAYENPQMPQQTPAYENPQMPQQTPAYGTPQMPQQTPAYENPQMPQQTPAYENPQMPQQTPAYGTPQMPQQTPTYGTPQMPQQTPAYGTPQMPQQTPAYGMPQMPQQTPVYGTPQTPQMYGQPQPYGYSSYPYSNPNPSQQMHAMYGQPPIPQPIKTKVVTVYAAKGGVGKTTIAKELSICLANTSVSEGEKKFRVCIVDYNIDFGDITSVLGFNDREATMAYWASDIRERIKAGLSADDIQFSRQEMEDYYLQNIDIDESTKLYALLAPIAHEDSTQLQTVELDCMLRNIVDNGEFDYVICDTGNNTLDSSTIAYGRADLVLIITTQDATAINCNKSLLKALSNSTLGVNADKIKIVLNDVLSTRLTKVSPDEAIEQYRPLQCIAKIPHVNGVKSSNNQAQPLVLWRPKDPFSKEILRIMRYVAEGKVPPEEPKKGLFRNRKK